MKAGLVVDASNIGALLRRGRPIVTRGEIDFNVFGRDCTASELPRTTSSGRSTR